MNRRKSSPRKTPGVRYTSRSFHDAIQSACARAGVEPWHPHQLRHTHATEVRRRHGLEAAQVALGHANAAVTEVYAERDLRLAMQIAEADG
jgi:integrase